MSLSMPSAGDFAALERAPAFAALGAAFAASGCAALIYQIVWFEQLSLVVGASAPSLGALLATFLGGLCLGSWLLPRLVSSQGDPLGVCGALELGIAALAIATLYALPIVGRAYVGASGDGMGLIARALACALLLLPPTMLMGASLPAVAGAFRDRTNGAARLGFLYAANIAGGVAGAVLAAFALLRALDATAAVVAAAALNVAASALCFGLAKSVRHARRGETLARPEPAVALARPDEAAAGVAATPAWPLYAATALSGATALAAEVIWTRHLTLIFGGTVYAYALILAVFLGGLGAGSAAGAALARRASPARALAASQLLVCAAIAWAAYSIARWIAYWPIDVTTPDAAAAALPVDLLRTVCAALPGALAWGASFPLALAAAARATPASTRDAARRVVARAYAANTLGAIAGALGTTFVLVTWLGTEVAQQCAIVAAAGAALLAVWHSELRYRALATRAVATAVAIAAAVACALAVPPLPPELVAYGRFLPTRGLDANVVYVGEGLTASIAVTREPSGILTYHNAGKTQASTYPQDLRLQRLLGHTATLFADEPRTALVIGLGAGVTAGAVAADPAVERVVVAEIEPLVPHAADEFFTTQNFGVVRNPKVEIRIDDGRHVLATTTERFDAITSDPLDPWVKGAAALYTREFWRLCRSRLNDGGVVTAFLQLYETSEDAVKSEIATFFETFPDGALLANTVDGLGYDAVLVARAGGGPIDLDRIQARLERTAYARVAESLRAVGFSSALDLAGTYAGQRDDLARWLEGAAINTDRNLRLQYLAGDGVNAQRSAAIFAALTAHETRFPSSLFTGSPARLEELRQRLAARRGDY